MKILISQLFVLKGNGFVCFFRYVPDFARTSVHLFLPYRLPTSSQVNFASLSQRSCFRILQSSNIKKLWFSVICGLANYSTVTLSLPPVHPELVNLVAKILWIKFLSLTNLTVIAGQPLIFVADSCKIPRINYRSN